MIKKKVKKIRSFGFVSKLSISINLSDIIDLALQLVKIQYSTTFNYYFNKLIFKC